MKIGLVLGGGGARGILDIVEKVKPWRLLDVGRMGSLIGGRGMAHQMEKYLPATFGELAIPLAVTAVDLQYGKLVVLSEAHA